MSGFHCIGGLARIGSSGNGAALDLHVFPPLNASLNGLSAALLVTGFLLIKSGRIRAHAGFMIAALVTSTTFLTFYLIEHELRRRAGAPITRFPRGNQWWLTYQLVLWTHTPLAVVILPLIFLSFWRAWRRQWNRHRQISVITFPLWLYVSVTGVVIYLMLRYSGAYGGS